MSDEPDFAYDIDALFERLRTEFDHQPEDDLEWAFLVRSTDYHALQQAAHEFEDEFAIHLYEEVDDLDEEGNTSPGDPLMCVIRVGSLSADDVKAIAARVDAVAAARGLEYDGVQVSEPPSEDDAAEWLVPEDAVWRLRSLTTGGLEADAPLPWTLLVVAADPAAASGIAAALAAAGYDDLDQFDERDEEGDCGVCVFVPGTNNEAALEATMNKVASLAAPHAGELIAVQFYTRDEFYDAFSDEDEE